MRKSILTIGTAMLFIVGSATFIGCGNDEHHDGEHHQHNEDEEHHKDMGHNEDIEHNEEMGMEEGEHEHMQYQCPMKCEGDKMYEEEGDCPKCGMDLKEVE